MIFGRRRACAHWEAPIYFGTTRPSLGNRAIPQKRNARIREALPPNWLGGSVFRLRWAALPDDREFATADVSLTTI